MTLGLTVPTSDVDLFTDEALNSPYPLYDELRCLGPVVHLEKLGMFGLTRDDTVRRVLTDHQTFSSQRGVSLNDAMNLQAGENSLITVDPPLHQDLRRVFQRPLRPGALNEVAGKIRAEAQELIGRYLNHEEFDGVTDLASYLPVTIVSRLIGIPEDGREQMLEWANAVFDLSGPDTERGRSAGTYAQAMLGWAFENVKPPRLEPNGWAQQMFDAGAAGEVPEEWVQRLAIDYMFPSLDTTINATSSLLWLLATHPDQWARLKSDSSLIPGAIGEAIRLETPIQFFTRVATREVELGDITLSAGDRVLIMFGSANRDEVRWSHADEFDITRPDATRHVGFGLGEHSCVGQGLAQLEMQSLLSSLLAQVDQIEIDVPTRRINQTMRGFARLPMRFV